MAIDRTLYHPFRLFLKDYMLWYDINPVGAKAIENLRKKSTKEWQKLDPALKVQYQIYSRDLMSQEIALKKKSKD
ncbi:uncharacterized protein LOC108112754 isoform X2 [Drosophila eugracilis]|uniref:uncharacterized protein LOC108112754 isoform X2 n=1 Tax=Drosophila eugracilis TaxID=29029 RepID=UPI0007E674F2|nr:uncharacterized protein LOC108112754 isoform X2 [Drosophila eugracilis]